MRKLIIILLLLCTNAYAWEAGGKTAYTPVDLLALDKGYYVSSATITGSVSAIPLYGNFQDRRSINIANRSDYYYLCIVNDPGDDPMDEGYTILPNSSLTLDMGSNVTNSTVYALTSDSTVTISVSTIELR